MNEKFHIIFSKNYKKFEDCLPDEYISNSNQEKNLFAGFETADGDVCGASVFTIGPNLLGESGRNLILEWFFIKPEYRNKGLFNLFIERLHEYSGSDDIAGLIAPLLTPQLESLEEVFFRNGFIRLKDGNSVYALNPMEFKGVRMFPENKKPPKLSKVVSFDTLSRLEINSFFNQAGNKYPNSLSVASIPGEWSRKYSYVYRFQNNTVGFLLTSVLEDNTLYLGSLFVEKEHYFAAALLIDQLISDLENTDYFKKIMFTAASETSLHIAEYLIKKANTTPDISTVRNYYLKLGLNHKYTSKEV